MTAIRLRCLVPFCTHTIGPRKGDEEPITEGMQWICRRHWMAIPAQYRRAYSRAWNWERGKPYRRKGAPLARSSAAASWRLWRRCKQVAIEKAMGI